MNLSAFIQLTGRVSRSVLLALAVSLAGVGQAKEQWHVYDVLGNTVASVNADAVVAEVEATAFGESRTPAVGARFTGKPYDADLAAHVFPFRNYRSDAGRWTSADPSGFPDGVNSDLYAPNPTSGFDATGAYSTTLLAGSYTTSSGNSGAISQNTSISTSKGALTVTHYEVQSGLPSSRGGVELDVSPSLTQTSGMLYFWQQTYTVTTQVPLSGVNVTNVADGNPYYNSISSWGSVSTTYQAFFSDLPNRTYAAYLGSLASNNQWIQTDFTLRLVMVSASVVSPGSNNNFSVDPNAVTLATINWGYRLVE